MECLNCSKEIVRGKYCSNQCQQDYRRNQLQKELENADVLPGGHGRPGRRVKQYLIDTRGHRCEICNRKTWQNKPIPLVLDHIDGNPDNWHRNNVRIICPNCDHQTDTFAGKNKKNPVGGRAVRMSRYRNGLTY